MAIVDWLLTRSEPWVRYNALREFGGSPAAAAAAYDEMRAHPAISDLADGLAAWPSPPLGRAYDPKDPIWRLGMAADFGLKKDDPRIATAAEQVLDLQADDGGFLQGGFDHAASWNTRPYICISHVMTYALAVFGYLGDERLERAYAYALNWQRLDGGWHPNALNLPGGKKEAEPSCPFGTVNVLRALAAHPQHRQSNTARRAAELLLDLWERRDGYRPVGFGIGSTWKKLQYPLVQYQVLKTLDTLSMIPAVHSDPRYREMLNLLLSKRNPDGTWTADGINKPYAAFDFGQKKAPSGWLTFLAVRILMRSGTPTS